MAVPMEHTFDEPLGIAVRVDPGLYVILGDKRGLGDAVGCTRGRGHDVFHTRGKLGSKQVESIDDIVLKIALRTQQGFADVRTGSKMHDSLYFIFAQDLGKERAIRQISFDERSPT